MPSFHDVPDEILLNILELSVLYHSAFNSSLVLGPNSIWSQILRHKNSIVLVSKRWNLLATPLLYRKVSLRRVSQLQPLMNTISESTLGLLIRELEFTEWCTVDSESDVYVDIAYEENVEMRRDACNTHIASIQTIPDLCPKLRRLSIRTDITRDCLTHILSKPGLSQITEVELGESIEQHFRLDPWIFEAASRLRLLSIAGSNIGILELASQVKGIEALEFPALEELRIAEEIRSFPGNWSLPTLTRLTIAPLPSYRWNGYSVFEEPILGEVHAFLRKNGAQLRYLVLLCCELIRDPPIATILSYCPKVEHLVVDELPVLPDELQFPNISSIDIYSSYRRWPDMQDVVIDRVANFPCVRTVQYLVGRSDFENTFLQFPVPFDMDMVCVFDEACTWLGSPAVKTQTYSLKRSSGESELLVQTIGFLPSEADSSDEDSDYTPSISASDEESEISEDGEDEGPR